jgi:hypothetical protein
MLISLEEPHSQCESTAKHHRAVTVQNMHSANTVLQPYKVIPNWLHNSISVVRAPVNNDEPLLFTTKSSPALLFH